MRLYLAGPFEAADDIGKLGLRLQAAGHVITSRWHDGHAATDHARELRRQANVDLADIDNADGLVLVTIIDGHSRGGRHFETGYAHGTGKVVVIFGPRLNVFHHLAGVRHASDVGELIRLLATEQERYGAFTAAR